MTTEIIKNNLRDYFNSEYFRKVCKKRHNKKLRLIKELPEFFNTNYYNISSIQFTLARFSLHKLDYSDTLLIYPYSIIPQFKIFFNNIPRKALSSYSLTIVASGEDCQISQIMFLSYRELKMLRDYLLCASSEIKKNYDYTENEINNYYL